MPGSSPTELFIPTFFFFPFFVVVFYKYIAKQLLLNKVQQTARKVLCFQRKYRAPYIKYVDKQSEFLLFPTIYCGKTRVDNHLIIIFLNSVPASSFYRLIVIILVLSNM